MAKHTDFGKTAEDLAASYLAENGYKIIARNYRFQKAEIDIIAEINNDIIIVEVKARGTDFFMEPHEAVNKRKIRLIINAADAFMNQSNRHQNVRFDIISVLPNKSGKLEITHIKDAFQSFDAN